MKTGDQLDVDIYAFNRNGEGLCRHGGVIIFVPGGVPGDKATIKVRKIRNNYGSAELVRVESPSPHRVPARCRAYARGCGGCQWLHLNYKTQLEWKEKLLRDALKYLTGISPRIPPVLGMKPPDHFRNKLSLISDQHGRLGLTRQYTQTIISFDECRQELPSNMMVYEALKNARLPKDIDQVHIRSTSTGEAALYFYCRDLERESQYYSLIAFLKKKLPFLSGSGLLAGHHYRHVSGEPWLRQKVGETMYAIPPQSFFQTNYPQAEALLQQVDQLTSAKVGDTVLDLYAGVGFFSLALARSGARVVGIENNGEAVKAARYTAASHGLKDVSFMQADVLEALSQFTPGSISKVVLDPPRMGTTAAVLERLLWLRPPHITYVSCSLDTLARDLRTLVQSEYAVQECRSIDMFPHTCHLEVVVHLSRQAGGRTAPPPTIREKSKTEVIPGFDRKIETARKAKTGKGSKGKMRPKNRRT